MTAQEIVKQLEPQLPLPTMYVQLLQCARKMVRHNRGDWEFKVQDAVGNCTFVKGESSRKIIPPASAEAYC